MESVVSATVNVEVVLSAVVNLLAAVIGGIVVAALGIRTWRMQVRAKVRHDVALQVRRALCSFRRAIAHVRFRMKADWEFVERPGRDAERLDSGEEHQRKLHYRDEVYVYQSRFKVLQDAAAELDDAELEAEAVLGPEIINLLKPVRRLSVHLHSKVRHYLHDLSTGHGSDEKTEAVIFDRSEEDKPDKFSKDLQAKIDAVENYTRPYIQMKGKSSI